ncbi:hypothetical protein Tco_0138734 [Tanacetum coccineum]
MILVTKVSYVIWLGHVGSLEDDEEGLLDVLVKLETSFGLKSHDCHIMMQRLLPYELQQFLPDEVAKPIIELCLFFKKICSATLIEDDMLKAHEKLEQVEALEGGPIRPRWMFPFERFMKKLKGYVRNKAKPEGSIAKGYVAEEALTFSSYYFWDVTTKFNRPDRNVDPPPLTCQFQVFRLLCKSIGLRSVIRFDAQELKKVIWYVLHNSPEINTYWSQFKRCQQMLHGVMAVTVAVMIVPLYTRYPPVVGVAWATEVKAPENPIWVAGVWAGSIPARRPET